MIVDRQGKLFVIDWIWGIGDLRFDVAWTCSLMARSGERDFAADFFRAYAAEYPPAGDNFDYFKILAASRWIANVTASMDEKKKNGARSEEKELFFRSAIETEAAEIEKRTGLKILS
ncbi:aminoglycoside phosphotransferase family protein [Brucepastera parasyntrophica]|uniref:aminoglycoside phosphotransferase family protein n=1 Tax=Brucepastera parasyntrophica TaxID=2880008 RepID=UPI00210A246B|nr:aminoglycoside phosphotransferase family protein [Brucepastera parasyntrophica]